MSGARKNTRVPVPHTQAIIVDRRQRPSTPPPVGELAQRIEQLVIPALEAQRGDFHRLGLRERVLTLPATAALVISLVWRHLGSISDAVRVLGHEGLLWTERLSVTRQSVAERLRTLPSSLFSSAFDDIVETITYRARQRPSYKVGSPIAQRAAERFSDVLIADASTLDAITRKLALARKPDDADGARGRALLAGKMLGVLDALTRQPRKIFYDASAETNEQCFWDQLIAALPEHSLVLLDRGFCNYARFEQMSRDNQWVLTRLKSNARFEVIETFEAPEGMSDQLVRIGSKHHHIATPMRVITEMHNGTEYRYLTNVLDRERLATADARPLYALRWRIEDAFSLVKRLLGLAYFHGCSQNAIELQLWATWILYAALIDLRAELADRLHLPAERLSVGMIYRSLYFYGSVLRRGEDIDLIEFLATDAKRLGLIKFKRKTRSAFDTRLQIADDA